MGSTLEIHALYPHLTTVGEVFNQDATITSSFAGGVTRNGVDTGLDTPFDFPSYFALRDVFLHDAPMSHLAAVWRFDALYPHPERLVPFLGNHDTTRFMSEPGATPAKLRLAFTVLLTMRGMPQIYAGDEIAMHGEADPDNRRDFPGGFAEDLSARTDAIRPNAFAANSRTPVQEEMHRWVKGLLDLRRSHTALQTGEEQVLWAHKDLLVYIRGDRLHQGCSSQSNERDLVVTNKGDEPRTFTVPVDNTGLDGCAMKERLWGAASFQVEGDTVRIVIPAKTSAIASFN